MQILIVTSRSINRDKFYNHEQKKRLSMHKQNIMNASSTSFQSLRSNDDSFKNRLKKAKSAAKLFEKEQNKMAIKSSNKILLDKLVNIQPTYKTIRIKKSLSKQKIATLSSMNWVTKKRQEERIKKQNNIMTSKIKQLQTLKVKDIKKKIKEEIKQYLELKNSVRKMPDFIKDKRSFSHKKISMGLPLTISLNQEQSQIQKSQKSQFPKQIKSPTSIIKGSLSQRKITKSVENQSAKYESVKDKSIQIVNPIQQIQNITEKK